jgi:RHS repeat-associated protein
MVLMTEKYRSSTKYDEDYHFSRCLPASFSAVVQKFADSFLCRGINPFSFAGDCSLIIAPALGRWIISETQNINGNWTTSYYGYDGHNSVRFLTNASGAVTDNYTFDAFGIKIAGSGTTPNQILYSGEYLDPGTGNYDLRNRIYAQNSGTFLTSDTTPGQLPYVYTADNPVMMVDPSGNAGIMDSLAAISILSTLSGAIGGVAGAAQYHSVRGFVGGFWGSLIGTETSLLLLVDTPFFAPFGPAGAAAAFGIGSALGTATDIIIREGSFDAVRTQSSIIEIAASLLVGMLAGGTGSLESVFAQKEMAEQIGSMPAVKAVLGQIVNKTGVLPKAVAESGLTNSFFTLARLYAPEFANLAKEILISGGIDKIEEAAILPVVQFVVTAVGGAISDPMGGGP